MTNLRSGLLFTVWLVTSLGLMRPHPRNALPPVKPRFTPIYTPQTGPIPRFVTYHLAMIHLTDDYKWPRGNEYSGLYDLKKNYSIRDGDGPDGCEHILTLRPGTSWEPSGSDRGELQKAFRGVRLRLITGRGVLIGDTPQDVERKIGKPTLTGKTYAHHGHRFFQTQYLYKGKRFYEARYDYKDGKLNEIMFREARPPSPETGPNGGCP